MVQREGKNGGDDSRQGFFLVMCLVKRRRKESGMKEMTCPYWNFLKGKRRAICVQGAEVTG